MHRLLVALLSAFDAVIAAAAALAVALATLTVLWFFGIGQPDWSALWPAAASIWQLGNLVPLSITLPDAYLVETGIPAAAASFTLSVAPLAFAAFTAVFAARSGSRSAGAGAWITGVVSGTVVFALLAAGIALTSANPVARPVLWQAVLLPAAIHGVSALVGAIVTAWRDGDDGLIDDLHARVVAWRGDWSAVPGLAVRGAVAALAGLVGIASLVLAVALVARGGEIIALYETAQVDGLGATLLTIGELMYLPTLVVWALAWVAGPGFALGPGTAVSPAGTQVGVVPGIPILGAVPESVSPWLLLVLLAPVGAGALAGWIVRSRLVAGRPAPASSAAGSWWSDAAPSASAAHEAVGPRVVLTVAIAVLSGGVAAVLSLAAAGSMGPGRLAAVGPSAGPVALAVGLEVLVGAGILLLSPRRAGDSAPSPDAGEGAPVAASPLPTAAPAAPAASVLGASAAWSPDPVPAWSADPTPAASPDPADGETADLSALAALAPEAADPAPEDRPDLVAPEPAETALPEPVEPEAVEPTPTDADETAPIDPIDPTALGSGRPTPLPPID